MDTGTIGYLLSTTLLILMPVTSFRPARDHWQTKQGRPLSMRAMNPCAFRNSVRQTLLVIVEQMLGEQATATMIDAGGLHDSHNHREMP
eukprot:6176022-Pleurochrysis_carterae.AAC.1